MKWTLKIDDVVIEPMEYEERWIGGLLTILVKVSEPKDLDKLNKMIESEGYYPVYKVAEKVPRQMKIQKIWERKSGDASFYCLELVQKGSIFSEHADKTAKLAQLLLYKVPKNISFWFNVISVMFILTFVVGISLIVVAIWRALSGSNDLMSLILASAGGASIIASLIAVPPLRLQQSRINFTQWAIAFHGWLLVYFNTYEKTLPLFRSADWQDYTKYNDYLLDITNKTLKTMEETCEIQETARSGKTADQN